MKKTFVYDVPTRVFHWLFALLFIVAFTIASTVDDDLAIFSYHMIAGMVMFLLVTLRVVWGIFGTKYARFTSFSLHPRTLLRYFKELLTGDKRKCTGHNPATSWAAIVMMFFAMALGVTGYLMASEQGGEDLKEVHEILANGFFVIVLLHIAGVALHTLSHKDAIWKSILSGSKTGVPEESNAIRPYRAVGILLLAITVGFSAYLVQNFDAGSRDLVVFGSRLHLGEAEDE